MEDVLDSRTIIATRNTTSTRFSHEQLHAIEVAARVSSVFSVIGSIFIISTFVSSSSFRKSINRLVFFATWGNLLANVATLMSTSAIPTNSHLTGLCEFQGVLIQWFLMADSLWVFCMAMNVFLVFFFGYDSRQLRHLEKWYFLVAYGIPAIPAIAYVILDHTGHRVIGPATLWCWVRKDVDWMRISFFYAPVWIVVSATLTIYIVTGLKIFRKRALLRSFARPPKQPSVAAQGRATPEDNFVAGNNIVVTTQIKYDVQQDRPSRGVSPERDQESVKSYSSTQELSNNRRVEEVAFPAPAIRAAHQGQRRASEVSVDGSGQSGYRATAFAANPTTEPPPTRSGRSFSTSTVPARPRTVEGNAAAMAYLKVAFLMFIAMFVVWIPSSVNRLYQFTHRDHPSFILNIISAVVLPLQGFWNAVIYMSTTRAECRRLYGLILAKFTGKAPQYPPRHNDSRLDTFTSSRTTRDSITEITPKQAHQTRHSEVFSIDSIADYKPYRDEEAR